MNIKCLFTDNPYCLKAREKRKFLAEFLWKLTIEHMNKCLPYKRILKSLPISLSPTDNIEDIPMLPVRLFKSRDFRSVTRRSVAKILTSSRTTTQIPAHIFLDKKTIELAFKAFASVVGSVIGKKDSYAILVDTPSVAKDGYDLNIRNYTLRAWNSFCKDSLFLLDDSMRIKRKELNSFLKKHKDGRVVLFGLTFIIWQHLYQPLVKNKRHPGLADSILFHTGGWKRVRQHPKDKKTFKLKLSKQLGLKKIYNFYGMTELVGVIFLECEEGHFHAPDFADILIRDPVSLKPLPAGHKGLIQVFSPLAQSFPGHSLLTEDLGEILGEDDCPCGRNGKYFHVHDRMPWAEIRGCSNSYAYAFYSTDNS